MQTILQSETSLSDLPPGETVLVTGGAGYLAGWVIVRLLQGGYQVRTTLRNHSREGAVRAAVSMHGRRHWRSVQPGSLWSNLRAR